MSIIPPKAPKKYSNKPLTPWDTWVKKEESINDKISEDVEATIAIWLEEGYTEIEPEDILKTLDASMNIKGRYVRKDLNCRKGGIIKKIDKELGFIFFYNYVLHIGWSVQISDLLSFFWAPIAKRKATDPKDPLVMKELAKLQKGFEFTSWSKMWEYVREHEVKATRNNCKAFFEKTNKSS